MTAAAPRWALCFALLLGMAPLHAEDQDRDSKAPVPHHAIADGTTFLIRLQQKLDVSQVQPGKRFKAKLEEDMVGNDQTMIFHGSRIRGHVSAVGSGFHPRLLLSFDGIETEHGWAPLMATISAVPGEHGLAIGDEGAIERESQGGGRRDPDSDGIAERAEATANTLRGWFGDHRLQLRKGTILEVRLDRPLRVPWH
jgi:hypothetical protein